MNTHFALENPIEVLTGKRRPELTRDDLINIINKKNIERMTFHYTASDGRVKELRLPITSYEQAEIEFLPIPVEDAADVVVLGKWLCQSIANRYSLIDEVIEMLTAENDEGLNRKIHSLPDKEGRKLAEDYIKRGIRRY
ncbi:hypothetical protein [Marispirochaeta sp.]|jgi:hypothetical protein|uniref:hypothetical protein n=1 Tax=Marispirochaeta sp. TaxID=2038653 RepID=UPI0029C89716|nr:hypothetical protein [Marispirochaeta sp.]